MAAKSSHAFRTISEASDELNLKPHVLRFWEVKFPDLQPVTRAGGRRFYRPEDIDFLRGLKILLHEERMKIKDVQKILKRKGAEEVIKLGASSVTRRPPRPVQEKNLVPKHITPSVPLPEPSAEPGVLQSVAPPASDTSAQPRSGADIVPFSAARPVQLDAKPSPAAETLRATHPEPAAKPSPEPIAGASVSSEELEGALDRLAALRSRWKKFSQ